MHERALLDEEYEDDDPYTVQGAGMDPISEGVGQGAYLARYTLDECVEHYPASPVYREPDTFERFYFGAEPQVLIDVLADGDAEQLALERSRKHVAFKERWCKDNDRLYVALRESEADNAQLIRERVRPEPGEKPLVVRGGKPAAPKRSGINRPKAAV